MVKVNFWTCVLCLLYCLWIKTLTCPSKFASTNDLFHTISNQYHVFLRSPQFTHANKIASPYVGLKHMHNLLNVNHRLMSCLIVKSVMQRTRVSLDKSHILCINFYLLYFNYYTILIKRSNASRDKSSFYWKTNNKKNKKCWANHNVGSYHVV